MAVPDNEATESPKKLSLLWQNTFVWLAGFFAFLTLVRIFEYTLRPAELSVIELIFFAAVFILGRRQFAGANQDGRSKWEVLVELSIALVIVLAPLAAAKWGSAWLGNSFGGVWDVVARFINADIVWLFCFLLAIYHPDIKSAIDSQANSEPAAETKP
jgi:sterol desaturase/sphingolipid hydroxylase (fatty acid hydroxylase superfamily)